MFIEPCSKIRTDRLEIGDETYEDRTDGNGCIEQEIDAGLEKAKLTVEIAEQERYTWTLRLGQLDPIEETSGVQGRLSNLGYTCPVTGTEDAPTREAVRRFQHDQSLDGDGSITERTRGKLREVYGC
jgi:hypothetical protein